MSISIIALICTFSNFCAFDANSINCPYLKSDFIAKEAEFVTIFVSEKGDDNIQDCGTEAEPCKTIGKGIEQLGKNAEAKTLKIIDSASTPYGFLFSEDFSLTITTNSQQAVRRTMTFDLNELAGKGKFHLTNEKILKLEHITFNLLPLKNLEGPKETDESTAIILSKGVSGDLTIHDCGTYIEKWTDDYAPFSVLMITEGKVTIDEFDFISSKYYYLSNAIILHISEGVNVQKLKGFNINNVKLNKDCALELPSSYTLEGSNLWSVERKSGDAALINSKSGADQKVAITISKCFPSSSESQKSSKGGCFYFEMLHPESVLNILNTKFRFGKAMRGGGVMIGATKGKVKLENVQFEECEAIEDGGGLLILDLTHMAEFECINVTFEECKSADGGGVKVILEEEGIKGDTIFFKNCFFSKNEAEGRGNDATIRCNGDSELIETPFDASSFSMTEKNRVCVIKNDGSTVIHDDWLRVGYLNINTDAENGVDSAECGQPGKTACKTIKQAIENCLPGRSFKVYTTDECNKYDTEPITVEWRNVEITNMNDYAISITTVLDEMKVQQGEGMFNVKQGGYLELYKAKVEVDTTRKSGRDNGLFVGDGEDAGFCIYRVNVTAKDPKQALNCVLIECKIGDFEIRETIFEHFTSAFALMLADNSKKVDLIRVVFDSITTTSKTQSVVTILSGCLFVYGDHLTFSNCNSIEHKIGGALHLEFGKGKYYSSFYDLRFINCSCKSPQTATGEMNSKFNEESKGGAMYIRAIDEATDKLKLRLNNITFTNCSADKGENIFLSFPVGLEQIDEEIFEFEMEGIYGKQNYVLLEERKDGENNIVDLLSDEKYKIPYHSKNIYVGGEASSKAKTCGRAEEPCDLISTGIHHGMQNGYLTMLIIDRVYVDEPLLLDQFVTLSSAPKVFSSSLSTTAPNRGTLRVGSNIKARESKAVFEMNNDLIYFNHIDIEYPDAVEGDALDIVYCSYDLEINDVVFRPWYTGLKGENVLGGEGKPLPYTLITYVEGVCEITQLNVQGRNGNITGKSKHSNSQIQNYRYFEKMDEMESNSGTEFKINENDDPLCSWDSGLISVRRSFLISIVDSSFYDISEGAILSNSSGMDIRNISFANNHPIGENWEKYPSMRHNIRIFLKSKYTWPHIHSLAPGSDGLDGKPFGMVTEKEPSGTVVENMDSYFFSPVLKNVTLKREEEAGQKNELQSENEIEKEIEAIVRGSYLFPCGLTFEASKKKKGEEMKWTNCPVSEYTNETEMRVKIPQSIFDVDEYTSVVCRLTYSNGVINGENKHSASVILAKRKKNDPHENNPTKPTKTHLVAIIASTSAFAVVAVVVVIVTVACVVRSKKRNQYKTIKDAK
ncbi:uncharacterized protein MONOS_2018 [Monocercomonoides exilis]|uniref:uncharacterized protein n=1 Tax=Monocercomonoides exilis TaxID=2049356 RepID=UPI003559CDDF|nr:hypothetical protein MONOS_2018 [Monocercomonoides exilis]|eukprot:MONOS_2018.1-p1 / transcript=MONOS_2018.1 / gene=MONOS_2018 / organism=Monocercomonoides_exilis_PA203 / gene_product=unspecified product / transcript_product=unspecified product / location=Mono_scaffold00039:53090-57166(+) / protein_length=1359 / sequence_SO=supercontig / SO=protein_coding / is_pseudo=false